MKKMWVVLPAVFLIASILFNVVSFASTGTVGSDLYALSQKTTLLREQNRALSAQLATQQSLAVLLETAKARGFVSISGLVQIAPKSTQVALDLHK